MSPELSLCSESPGYHPGQILKDLENRMKKPPIHGYNYRTITLAGAAVAASTTFPALAQVASYKFLTSSIIVGIGLASSIKNPDGSSCAILVGLGNQTAANANNGDDFLVSHVSLSTNVTSRTGGISFGENSGLEIPSQGIISVYLAGTGGNVQITYTATIIYIGADQAKI